MRVDCGVDVCVNGDPESARHCSKREYFCKLSFVVKNFEREYFHCGSVVVVLVYTIFISLDLFAFFTSADVFNEFLILDVTDGGSCIQ